MKNYDQSIGTAKEILKTLRYYDSIGGLMGWDLWQGLPADGRGYRQEVNGYFVKQALSLINNNDTKKLVEYFRELDLEKYENIYDRAAARILVKEYDRAVKIPVDLQIEMNNFTAEAQMVWREALNKSDFNMYKPYLKRMFELKTQIAQAIDKSRDPFEVLVGDVDEGLTVGKVDQLFSELKTSIIEILGRIKNKHASIDNSILNVNIDKETIKKIGTGIAEEMFFDKNKGTYSEVVHPVCVVVGPTDVRITTYFNDLFSSIFSTDEPALEFTSFIFYLHGNF